MKERLAQKTSTENIIGSLLAGIDEGFCALDKNHTIIYSNKAFEIIVRSYNSLGNSIFHIMDQDTWPGLARYLDRVVQSGKPVEFETEEISELSYRVNVCIFEIPEGFGIRLRETTPRQKVSTGEFQDTDLCGLKPSDIVNLAHGFIWIASNDGAMLFFNERWYDYSGQTKEQALGFGWVHAMHPEDQPQLLALWEDGRKRGMGGWAEMRYRRRDGVYRWFISYTEPLRDNGGQIIGWFGTTTDITDRKLAEEHRKTLVDELNHRVKNTLATVQSIAALTYRASPKPEVFMEGFQNRLYALSSVHNLLTRSQWQGAALKDILREELEPYGGSTASSQISTRGDDVYLPARLALTFAMVLHELATNAAKHGALLSRDGRIAITWRIAPDQGIDWLWLEWEETGGPTVQQTGHAGFGSRLISRSVEPQLGEHAELEFRETGVRCSLKVILSESYEIPTHAV